MSICDYYTKIFRFVREFVDGAVLLGYVIDAAWANDKGKGVSIDDPVEDGDTALHLACLYGHQACVQLLLERGASLESKDEEGAIPLHDACAGEVSSIEELMHVSYIDLYMQTEESVGLHHDSRVTILHFADWKIECAPISGFIEIVRLLIAASDRADCVRRMLTTVDTEGDTPLHHAARGEHLDVVRLLLDLGASPTTPNSFGKASTPAELPDPGTEVRSFLEAAVSQAAICQ
ncbi:hypothetical protein ACLOJK_000571 [Asimina triloba]